MKMAQINHTVNSCVKESCEAREVIFIGSGQ